MSTGTVIGLDTKVRCGAFWMMNGAVTVWVVVIEVRKLTPLKLPAMFGKPTLADPPLRARAELSGVNENGAVGGAAAADWSGGVAGGCPGTPGGVGQGDAGGQ